MIQVHKTIKAKNMQNIYKNIEMELYKNRHILRRAAGYTVIHSTTSLTTK